MKLLSSHKPFPSVEKRSAIIEKVLQVVCYLFK